MGLSLRKLATSEHPAARRARAARRAVLQFSVPAPRLAARPALWAYLAVRTVWHFVLRVFVAEPLFKAYCTTCGRNVHTGIFVHWVMGKGEIHVGDNVTVDGKCSIVFTPRYSDRPTLSIGDNVYIGHNTTLTVARHIRIGSGCYLAGNVVLMESCGHPTEPEARRAGLPPAPEDVRPVTLGDNVWLARDVIVMPGVTIGDNSVVGAGAVVTRDVPAGVVAAGVPARVVREFEAT